MATGAQDVILPHIHVGSEYHGPCNGAAEHFFNLPVGYWQVLSCRVALPWLKRARQSRSRLTLPYSKSPMRRADRVKAFRSCSSTVSRTMFTHGTTLRRPLQRRATACWFLTLRGYGTTQFLDASAPRMGEQAAIGQDVIDFADALHLDRFAVAGYDWGGRAAAIAAALHPDRVRATVLIGGYTIQDTVGPSQPSAPEAEQRIWYQYYFNTERGRAGLKANRKSLCRFLWQTWSPNWHFSDDTYNRTAASFDNPDFVDVVIHSYRHRIGNAAGEPRFLAMEQQLAKRPKIQCPSITLYGADDGIARPPAESTPAERAVFSNLVARRVVDGVGHFMPREKPEAVSAAMLELMSASR